MKSGMGIEKKRGKTLFKSGGRLCFVEILYRDIGSRQLKYYRTQRFLRA